jgi:hypothetical protein
MPAPGASRRDRYQTIFPRFDRRQQHKTFPVHTRSRVLRQIRRLEDKKGRSRRSSRSARHTIARIRRNDRTGTRTQVGAHLSSQGHRMLRRIPRLTGVPVVQFREVDGRASGLGALSPVPRRRHSIGVRRTPGTTVHSLMQFGAENEPDRRDITRLRCQQRSAGGGWT